MRLDQPVSDASGLPQLPRSPLAFARSAPAFTRALAAAQTQPNGTLEVPAATAQSIASASSEVGGSETAQPWSTKVRAGQTLSGIVREQMAQRGVTVSNGEALRLAQMVAQSNKMPNANLIHPGQQLNLDSLNLSLQQGLAVKNATQVAIAQNNANFNGPLPNASINSATQIQLLNKGDRSNNPVLEKTLDRAIEKGFMPASDKQAVMNKIIQLSIQHRFAPDDFARLTLMESDGMNPKASNSRCHGIIQFCDGPDRGAASVGYAQNPKAIMGKSVLQQLDLVAKYFDDTGLKNLGSAGLDDLYLTVLTPAARQETRPQVNLNIAGNQAPHLYVNRDVRAGITRQSIQQGLHQNANERLGLDTPPTMQPVSGTPLNRVQALKVSAYANATPNVVR